MTTLTEEQVRHIKARVAIASAVVSMEEALRENLSPAAIYRKKKNGKLSDEDARYLENLCLRTVKEAKKATAFVEKKLFAPGVWEEAYGELYTVFEIHTQALWLNPEQKLKALEFIKQLRENG